MSTPRKRLEELERQIAALKAAPTVQRGEAAPTQECRDGTWYVDDRGRVWLRTPRGCLSAGLL